MREIQSVRLNITVFIENHHFLRNCMLLLPGMEKMIGLNFFDTISSSPETYLQSILILFSSVLIQF